MEHSTASNSWDILCQNCGHRRGNHSTTYEVTPPRTHCPADETYSGGIDQWDDVAVFEATNPPQFQPEGWWPTKPAKVKKTKTTKPWEDKPNFGLGAKTKVPEPATTDDYTEDDYESLLADPSTASDYLTASDLKAMVQKMSDMSNEITAGQQQMHKAQQSKAYKNYVNQMSGLENPCAEIGINYEYYNKVPVPRPGGGYAGYGAARKLQQEKVAEVRARQDAEYFLRSNPKLSLVDMLVRFARLRAPEVRQLTEQLQYQTESVRQLQAEQRTFEHIKHSAMLTLNKQNDRIKELEAQVANMVPRIKTAPVSLDKNGRRFLDMED